MIINPTTALIVFVIVGTSGVVMYTAFDKARKLGAEVQLAELRPCFPWEGLPVPKFIVTKPEVLEILKER